MTTPSTDEKKAAAADDAETSAEANAKAAVVKAEAAAEAAEAAAETAEDAADEAEAEAEAAAAAALAEEAKAKAEAARAKAEAAKAKAEAAKAKGKPAAAAVTEAAKPAAAVTEAARPAAAAADKPVAAKPAIAATEAARPAAAKPAVAKAPEAPSNPVVVSAVISGLIDVVLLALFWFASDPAYRSAAAPSFIAMLVIVNGAMIAATAKPRITAHALATVFSLACMLAGFGSLGGGIPILLALVLIAMGAGSLLMTIQSYRHRSRPAWAFLSAILGVIAVCTLFGAPKVRSLIDVNMWIALMIPGLLTVACVAFGMISDDYRERGVVPLG